MADYSALIGVWGGLGEDFFRETAITNERFNSASYRVIERLQIYARRTDVLMTQYRLYRCYGRVPAGSDGGSEVTYAMEAKWLYASRFA